MPIDLVIDERDTTKQELGDSNNNSGAEFRHLGHPDTSNTPDPVSTKIKTLGSGVRSGDKLPAFIY